MGADLPIPPAVALAATRVVAGFSIQSTERTVATGQGRLQGLVRGSGDASRAGSQELVGGSVGPRPVAPSAALDGLPMRSNGRARGLDGARRERPEEGRGPHRPVSVRASGGAVIELSAERGGSMASARRTSRRAPTQWRRGPGGRAPISVHSGAA
jgi:hypothetical protein